jgi:hypothetical protein
MRKNKFGEIVLDKNDLFDYAMQGKEIWNIPGLVVDNDVDLEKLIHWIENPNDLITWTFPENSDISVAEFDARNQGHWFMPDKYKEMDIAAYILSLCETPIQLQRCGEELLLYQEKNLFDLLRYLKYLVDVMEENNVIWGVGRGSSVASYVLFLLKVHKIDSIYYDLDPQEFLR